MKLKLSFFLLLLWPSIAVADDSHHWAHRELILVSDGSSSMYPMNSSHYELQRDGYLYALADDEVRAALLAVPTAVRVVYFGGRVVFRHNIGPIFIRGPDDIDRLMEHVRTGTPHQGLPEGTNQCAGVHGAMATERVAPIRIYDVVTDEAMFYNGQAECPQVRDRAEVSGDEINILGIGQAAGQYEREKFEASLVTRHPEGFFMEADSWEDFAEAIKYKLLQELLF